MIADRLTENNELLKDIALNVPSRKQLPCAYLLLQLNFYIEIFRFKA